MKFNSPYFSMEQSGIGFLRRGFLLGLGFTLGIGAAALVAITVSGTVNTFASGDTVSASLVNQNFSSLKTAIESVDPQYSTGEVATHKIWTDGKTIYRKVITITSWPNGSTTNTAHGITNLDQVVSMGGIGTSASLDRVRIPHSPTNTANVIELNVNNTNVTLISGGNYSGFTGFIIMEYTKN